MAKSDSTAAFFQIDEADGFFALRLALLFNASLHGSTT